VLLCWFRAFWFDGRMFSDGEADAGCGGGGICWLDWRREDPRPCGEAGTEFKSGMLMPYAMCVRSRSDEMWLSVFCDNAALELGGTSTKKEANLVEGEVTTWTRADGGRRKQIGIAAACFTLLEMAGGGRGNKARRGVKWFHSGPHSALVLRRAAGGAGGR
jgi:hypothetical protein